MQDYERLEQQWAAVNGLDPRGMVACSSGSAALHLALEALQLPPRSEVLVGDFCMIACARAVTLAGLTPVFVDCGDDLNIDADLLLDWRTFAGWLPKPTVLMLVHVYGRRCSVDRLNNDTQGVPIIEDLAEAHGVRPHPDTDAACWSFYKNKIVAGEEGGAVWFKDAKHAELARCLRCQGFTPEHNFMHVPRGCNYRLANSLARLILNSLATMDMSLRERRKQEAAYDRHCPPEWKMPPRDVPWVYDLRLRRIDGKRQDRVVRSLQEKGIAARHAFKPMSCQDEYADDGKSNPASLVRGQLWHAWQLSQEVIYLPLYSEPVPARVDAFDIIRAVLKDRQ